MSGPPRAGNRIRFPCDRAQSVDSCQNPLRYNQAVEQSSSSDVQASTRPRFWVGPLLAGCCFAFGYGITHRVVTLQGNAENPQSESFESVGFPGEALQSLRSLSNDQNTDLQVDMVSIEAAEAVDRKAKQDAEKRVEEARPAELALQAPTAPAWTAPTWSQPDESPKPDQGVKDDASMALPSQSVSDPDTAVLVSPDMPDSQADSIPVPDPPVLVAEPESLAEPVSQPVLAPGFDPIEPVFAPMPPPQP